MTGAHGGERADARTRAMDPRRNIVLEASAGTGKTSVLVGRYVNLLRAGVDPANILAVTFTRKAATEMRNRIVGALRDEAHASDAGRERWHGLRDRLGEIAISTIDAFCLSLLREFPLEADLEPGFGLADETETPRILEHALDHALRVSSRVAYRNPDVALVLAQLGRRRLRTGLAYLLTRRLVASAALRRVVAGSRALSAEDVCTDVVQRLQNVLGGVSGGLEQFLTDGPVGHPRFAMLAHDLRKLFARHGTDDGAVRSLLERVQEYFLTQAGKPRQRLTGFHMGHFPTRHAKDRHLRAVRTLAPDIADISRAFHRNLNVVLVRGVRRLFRIAEREYRRTLDAHAALDFTDVQLRAVKLLSQMDEFAQSRYRLESRYHHVLVDEFQDTSRTQWELVSLLIQSWGEGLGLVHEAPLPPSVFIVGDRKQSIYRFRQADVAMLREAGGYIERLRPDGGVRTSIAQSFRAVPPLLEFINDLCGAIPKKSGRDAFTYDIQDSFPVEGDSTHERADVVRAGADSRSPVLGLAVADDELRCGEAVAAKVEHLLADERIRDPHTRDPRRVKAGDVAILFRSRASHREFERALEARGIASYVYKGLGFFDADEIKDLAALMKFLADPTSDLRAAAFMRSGFVRLSDAAIHELAPRLADAIAGPDQPQAGAVLADDDHQMLTRMRATVARWLGLVDRLPPAELIDLVLSESAYAYEIRGPRMAQAYENIKKMRSLLRRIQNRGYATLARIADHIEHLSSGDDANATVDASDAVHLMTIHAAKGLEFPVVFLVNLSRGTGSPSQPIRVVADRGDRIPMAAVGAYVSTIDESERNRELEETKRLLYVAITRARDRLYFASVVTQGKLKPGRGSLSEVLPVSFLGVFGAAMQDPRRDQVEWAGHATRIHRFEVCHGPNISDPNRAARHPLHAGDTQTRRLHDDFIRLQPRGVVPRVAATSYLADRISHGEARRVESTPSDSSRLCGALVHRLLSSCHAPETTDSEELKRRAGELLRSDERVDPDTSRRVVNEAVRLHQAIVRHETVQHAMRGDCLYEVPFSVYLVPELVENPREGPCIVRGVIDCLVRHDDGRVTVVEFKTGSPRPEHREQIALYQAAAEALFPAASVDGLLVYPEDPS